MTYNEIIKLARQAGFSNEEAEEFGMQMVFMGNPPEEVVISAIRKKLVNKQQGAN